MRKVLRWTEHILAGAGLWFLIYHFGFELIVMTSGSMAPTLQGTSYANGDRVLVEKLTNRWRAPRRWEIYYLHDAEGTPVAKRIVGLPGERVSIKGNRILVNGVPTGPPPQARSLRYFAMGSLTGGREVKCGDGFFVLGDDSADSYDSRFLGPVSREQLVGRLWCILWPVGRFGFVTPTFAGKHTDLAEKWRQKEKGSGVQLTRAGDGG